MSNTKKSAIIYWTTVTIIFLFEGVIPALTSQTEMAKEGIRHLGYPGYFGNALVVCKVLGALALLLPQVPNRIKEWAYVGFAFDFIFAAVSLWAVDGFGSMLVLPIAFLAILVVSYIHFEKRRKYQSKSEATTITNSYVVSGIPQYH